MPDDDLDDALGAFIDDVGSILDHYYGSDIIDEPTATDDEHVRGIVYDERIDGVGVYVDLGRGNHDHCTWDYISHERAVIVHHDHR